MFGKTRELHDDTIDGGNVDGFFGDETAADETAQIDVLRERVVQVESQISSQFTSLATYAQIAQEQIELARAEAKATTERSEKRVIELIERERADRISSVDVAAPTGSGRDVTARLDDLEHSLAQMKATLDECFAQQMALAGAINRLLEPRLAATPEPVPAAMSVVTDEPADVAELMEPVDSFDAPSMPLAPPVAAVASLPAPSSGPIPGLSLRLAIA